MLSYNPDDKGGLLILQDASITPTKYVLNPNFPNPFNSETVIKYQLPEHVHVAISVYNMLGQEIRRLVDEEKEAGFYQTSWDGKTGDMAPVSSGLYLLEMKTPHFYWVRKMMLIR